MACLQKDGGEMLKKKRFLSKPPYLPRVPPSNAERLEWKKQHLIFWLMCRELEHYGDL